MCSLVYVGSFAGRSSLPVHKGARYRVGYRRAGNILLFSQTIFHSLSAF